LAAAVTRVRVSSLIRCATAPPANTRLTVLTLVFVRRAMSTRVGGMPAAPRAASLTRYCRAAGKII